MFFSFALALLLSSTAMSAFAYYDLRNYAPPTLGVDGKIHQRVSLGYWDPKDPRPFPCGPRPTGDPELVCGFSLLFFSPRGEKIPLTSSSGWSQLPNSGYKTYGDFAVNANGGTYILSGYYPAAYWEPGACVKLAVNSVPLEGNSCLALPPPNSGICEFTKRYMSLTHNIVYSDAIDGNRATQVVTLRCESNPANIRIRLFEAMTKNNEVKLRPDGTLFSKLRVNGEDGEIGFRINNATGEHLIEISSTLRSVGTPEAGTFSGSGIAVIEYF